MSYVPPPVPERWDRGLWDQAHWNGQLGVTLTAVSFVFNGQAVRFGLNLRLIAEPASVVFTAPDVQFVVMHPLHWVMQAETCNLNFSAGWLQMRIYQQPGFYNLGMKVYVPRKR